MEPGVITATTYAAHYGYAVFDANTWAGMTSATNPHTTSWTCQCAEHFPHSVRKRMRIYATALMCNFRTAQPGVATEGHCAGKSNSVKANEFMK